MMRVCAYVIVRLYSVLVCLYVSVRKMCACVNENARACRSVSVYPERQRKTDRETERDRERER